MTTLIGLLFFLSGAVGLGYEIVWIKILTLQFGNSAWSISAVVAAFMAGLGLGSWLAGREGARFGSPLRLYAWLELGIALFGLLSIPIFENADRLLAPLYFLFESQFFIFILIRLALAFGILILPTFLMGASLPVLVLALSKKASFERVVGFLYGINTLGAAFGTLLAGFFLLPQFGIRHTILILMFAGLIVGAVAWYSSKPLAFSRGASKKNQPGDFLRAAPLAIYAAAFISGLIGIFYEVSWSRLLAPIMGSSTYAFSIILVTFLVGIGLGGLLVANTRLPGKSIQAYIGILLSLTALTAIAGLFVINQLPTLFIKLVGLINGQIVPFFIVQSLTAGALMFLPTLFMGVTLPLCMAYLEESTDGSVALVGRVYAINTVGSILGSLLAGFVFLPWVGVRNSILIMSGVGLAAGLLLIWKAPLFSTSSKQVSALWLAVTALFLYLLSPTLQVAKLQRGSFRSVLGKGQLSDRDDAYMLFVRDGITSTVTVFRAPDATWLNVNGKTDASSTSDLGSQYLIGHLPMFLMPGAKSACVIGFGSGATVNAVASHPIDKIDVVELEPAILDAGAYFSSTNDNVLLDPRVHVHLEDGRTFLKYRKDVYDVIISEPSNPWIVGVSSLFTSEFYRSVKKRLSPNGVFCQWIQDYEMSDRTRNGMLATLADEFLNVQLFNQQGDLIAVASDHPLAADPAYVQKMFERPAVKKTLKRISVTNGFDLFIGYLASFPSDRAIYRSAERNTDDNLWLEFRAPMEMYRGASPSLQPLENVTLFHRLCTLFFTGISSGDVAYGLADSIYRIRPYAKKRIQGVYPFINTIPQRTKVDRYLAAIDKRYELMSTCDEKIVAAMSLLTAEKYDDVLKMLQAHADAVYENNAVYRLRGEAFFSLRRITEAHASYQRAVDLNPDDYVSYVGLGVTSLLGKKPDEGERALVKAMELNPYYTPARANLGIQLIRTKRYEALNRLTLDSKKKLSPTQFKEYLNVLAMIPQS